MFGSIILLIFAYLSKFPFNLHNEREAEGGGTFV